jgi:hypothetical protein
MGRWTNASLGFGLLLLESSLIPGVTMTTSATEAFAAWIKSVLMVTVPFVLMLVLAILISVAAFAKSDRNKRD